MAAAQKKPQRRRGQPDESQVATCGLCKKPLTPPVIAIGIAGNVHGECADKMRRDVDARYQQAIKDGTHSPATWSEE